MNAAQFASPQANNTDPLMAPLNAFAHWAMHSPEFARLYVEYLGHSSLLWQRSIERSKGKTVAPVAVAVSGDRRFASPDWTASPFHDFLKQSYLLNAQFLASAVEAAELDTKLKGQMRFLMRQYVDALAPSNFAATNPDVLKIALASQGETMKRGLDQLLEDVGRGRISTVDESAFEVGRNLAMTAGAVVFECELFQLIQYAPLTPTVHALPLLIVPPCINKFYVLDLQPDNSFVRHAVASGHTVFMLSWRNPGPAQDQLGWDDYIGAIVSAIDTARTIARSDQINTLGFCVGGTLLTTAAAVMAARRNATIASITLLATLLDFSDTGEIGHFVTADTVAGREQALGGGGLLSGRELSVVFSALRDNDLVWSYVVNNYLKGERPAAFDILYWNADSTNLPGPMYAWYLRNLYLENKLREPGGLSACGINVNLSKIKVPVYLVATREDHIVPWTSAFQSTQLLGDDIRFVLGASGHIAGIINPALKNRRSYWTNDSCAYHSTSPQAWLAHAHEQPGSWWTDWSAWLTRHAGKQKKASRRIGSAKFQAIEPAPGRYVKDRI